MLVVINLTSTEILITVSDTKYVYQYKSVLSLTIPKEYNQKPSVHINKTNKNVIFENIKHF